MEKLKIVVASGKGGTGKTTIAVNLALSLDDVQFLDCDVEEPNANLFLKVNINKRIDANILIPEIDEELCNYCGKCRDVCAYKALAVIPRTKDSKGVILNFSHLCHSCGACAYVCPTKAIKEIDKKIGEIEIGNKDNINFVSGRLSIGEIMSPNLIRQVKDKIDRNKTTIIDAPPGTSCPVVAGIKDMDFCILVTEPTPFGLNDMILAVEVLRKLDIPFGVVLNRSDIGNNDVNIYCEKEHIPILLEIPFNEDIARCYSCGIPFVEQLSDYKQKFKDMFRKIEHILRGENHD